MILEGFGRHNKIELTGFGFLDLGLLVVGQITQFHVTLALLDVRLQVVWSIVTLVARLVLDHERDLRPRLAITLDHHVLVVRPVLLVQELENEIVVHILNVQELVIVRVGGGQHVTFVVDHLVIRVWWRRWWRVWARTGKG